MNNEFCTYEQSLALKELGFDKPCFSYYNPNGVFMWKIMCSDEDNDHTLSIKDIMEHKAEGYVECPLKQQAFKFFREKYGHYSEIRVGCTQIDGSIGYEWWIWEPNGVEEWSPEAPGEEWSYDTYEDAENACLDKLIEIVKNKNK